MTTKFKSNLILKIIKDIPKFHCLIELIEHSLKISIIEKITELQSELIKGYFSPMNCNKKNEYYLNYSFIISIKAINEENIIILEITNPVISNNFTLILSDFESLSFIFKKKININKIVSQIKTKIQEEKKFLLLGFNNIIISFKDFLAKGNKSKILDEIREDSYKFGRKYYENSAVNFKKNEEIMKNMKDEKLIRKLKEFETDLSQQDRMKKNIAYTSFDEIIGEFNIRTTYFINETIIFFLKIICIGTNSFDDIQFNKLNLDNILENSKDNNFNDIGVKKNNSFISKIPKKDAIFNSLNKNEEYSSTQCTSKKIKKVKKIYISQDDTKIPTPKFKQINYQIDSQNLKDIYNTSKGKKNIFNPLENIMNITQNLINTKITSLSGINQEINELCKIHSLSIPSDIFNIFCNTSEIIHRKFFQMAISHFLGNIFYIEEDKDGIIKIEDLYNFFLNIRALKNLLFKGENNKLFLSDIFN